MQLLARTAAALAGEGPATATHRLRQALDADAILVRTHGGDEQEVVLESFADDSPLAAHQNLLRAVALPVDGTTTAEFLDTTGALCRRLRGWGLLSAVVVASPPRGGTTLQLELYSRRRLPLDGVSSPALGLIAESLASAVELERLHDRRRANEAFVRLITDAGPTIVHVYAPDRGQTLFRNQRCREFLAPEQLHPDPARPILHNRHPWLQRVDARDRARLRDQLLRSEQTEARQILDGLYRFDVEGQIRHLRVWSVRIPREWTGSEDEMMITALDVSRQKQLEDHAEQLAMAERRELEREIHDGICQDLLGLKMSAQRMARNTPSPEELPERLTETVDALGVCLRRASAIAHGLPPARIESNELASALDALVETTGERFGVPCTSVLRGEVPPMPDEVSTQFYWIARECLLNAARHARAERIVLHLRGEDHRLRLRVMDDGQGFEPAGDGDGGMGLRILEHRADRIGAAIRIESTPGEGTTISCELQIHGSDDDDQ